MKQSEQGLMHLPRPRSPGLIAEANRSGRVCDHLDSETEGFSASGGSQHAVVRHEANQGDRVDASVSQPFGDPFDRKHAGDILRQVLRCGCRTLLNFGMKSGAL